MGRFPGISVKPFCEQYLGFVQVQNCSTRFSPLLFKAPNAAILTWQTIMQKTQIDSGWLIIPEYSLALQRTMTVVLVTRLEQIEKKIEKYSIGCHIIQFFQWTWYLLTKFLKTELVKWQILCYYLEMKYWVQKFLSLKEELFILLAHHNNLCMNSCCYCIWGKKSFKKGDCLCKLICFSSDLDPTGNWFCWQKSVPENCFWSQCNQG